MRAWVTPREADLRSRQGGMTDAYLLPATPRQAARRNHEQLPPQLLDDAQAAGNTVDLACNVAALLRCEEYINRR